MPRYSGLWTVTQQAQAIAAGTWTGLTFATISTWGSFSGFGVTGNRSSPVQVGAEDDWADISVGGASGSQSHIVAIKQNGTLWAWQSNQYGQLGIENNNNNVTEPTQVGALTNWKQVSAGSLMTLALKTDGTMWSWGININNGILGDGTRISRSSPVQIGSLTTWSDISTGGNHCVAKKTDGTLWAWGNNQHGQIGDYTTTSRSSPVQVGAENTWLYASCGGYHNIAQKNDGTIWGWGLNGGGRWGGTTYTSASEPTQSGSLSNWTQVRSGWQFTHGIKDDGTLWAWGSRSLGALGDNLASSSPYNFIQIGSLTTWSLLHRNLGFINFATKTDGTLWTWGGNTQGALGINSVILTSSPVQVGSDTDWTGRKLSAIAGSTSPGGSTVSLNSYTT